MKQKIKKSIEKINETKIGFFERINKIDESIARLVRRKKKKKRVREKIQIINMRNQSRNITRNAADVKMIIR